MPPKKKTADKTQDCTACPTAKKPKIIRTRTPKEKKPAPKAKNLIKPKDKTDKPQKKTKNPYLVVRQIAKDEKIRMANETALCQLTKQASPIEVAVNPEPKKKRGRQPGKAPANPERKVPEVQSKVTPAAPRTRAKAKRSPEELNETSECKQSTQRRRPRTKLAPLQVGGNAKSPEKTISGPFTDASDVPSPRNSECGSDRLCDSDTFAWTQDISSSSPATVASNSIILFDGKLPAVQLVDFKKQAKRKLDAPKAGPKSKKRRAAIPKKVVRAPSPFSSSSTSLADNTSTTTDTTEDSKANAIAQNRLMLNTIDMEFINWLSNDSVEELAVNETPLHEFTLKVLKHEIKAIQMCQEFRRKLGHVVEKKPLLDQIELVELSARSDSVVEMPIVDEDVTNVEKERVESVLEPPNETDKAYDFETFSDVMRRKTYEQSQYDDDALSLFAESLTGIDSSRDNIFLEPKTNKDLEPATIEPVEVTKPKILPTPIVINVKRPVCEKQNADSTSINKEETRPAETAQAEAPILTPSLPIGCTIGKSHIPMNPTRSGIYRGHCFFNILNKCNKTTACCLFPHTLPEAAVIQGRLQLVSNEVLLREYLLTKKYQGLRKTYMIYFVEECERRSLTRYLVEMAADCLAEEKPLRTAILETLLLHLNDKPLHLCEDLLVARVDGVFLCDALISALAETQNFTRFKSVFVSLTDFVVKICRTFPLAVVESILERVCILPYEESVVRATVALVRSTEVAIFDHQLMGTFLGKLGEMLPAVLEKLMLYRDNVSAEGARGPAEGAAPTQAPEPPVPESRAPPAAPAEENRRYTSPDTTHLDSLHHSVSTSNAFQHKSPEAHQPQTRTVTFNAAPPAPPRSYVQFSGSAAPPRRPAGAPRRGHWVRGSHSIFNMVMSQRFRAQRFPHRGMHYPRMPPPGYYGQ